MLARRIWNAISSPSEARCRLTLVRVAAYKRPTRWQRFNADKPGHWKKFFSDPSQYWDARETKGQSKFADFEHKHEWMALYIDKTDQDLQQKLALLDSSAKATGKVSHSILGSVSYALHKVNSLLSNTLTDSLLYGACMHAMLMMLSCHESHGCYGNV